MIHSNTILLEKEKDNCFGSKSIGFRYNIGKQCQRRATLIMTKVLKNKLD